jgi:hypothetical protein
VSRWPLNRAHVRDEVAARFQQNPRGEQSTSVYLTAWAAPAQPLLAGPSTTGAAAGAVRLPGRPLAGSWDVACLSRAILRFYGSHVETADGAETATFRIFVAAQPGDLLDARHPGYAGHFRKRATLGTPMTFFDVTRVLSVMAVPGLPVSFTIVLDTPGARFTWQRVELALLVREAPAQGAGTYS